MTTCCNHHGDCDQGRFCPLRIAAASAADAKALGQVSDAQDPMNDYIAFLQEMLCTIKYTAYLFAACLLALAAWMVSR